MALDVFQTVVTGQVAGQMVQNVIAFQSLVDNAPNPGLAARHLNAGWAATIQDLYLAMMALNYTQSSLRSRRINNGGGNSATSIAADVIGTWPDDASDALTGAQIHFPFTDEAGYYGTGKMFVPGAADDAIDNGRCTFDYIAEVNAFIDALITGFSEGGDTFKFVVWSPKLSAAFEPLGGGVSIKPGYIGRRLKPI